MYVDIRYLIWLPIVDYSLLFGVYLCPKMMSETDMFTKNRENSFEGILKKDQMLSISGNQLI